MALHHNDSSASKKFDHQNSQIRCAWGKWIKKKVLFSARKFIWDSLKTIEQKFFTKASENINIQHHGNNITSHYAYLVCVTTIQKLKTHTWITWSANYTQTRLFKNYRHQSCHRFTVKCYTPPFVYQKQKNTQDGK